MSLRGGRGRADASARPRRGPLAAAVLAAAAGAGVALAAMPVSAVPFAAAFAGLAGWIAAADLATFEIPDEANLALLVLGLVWAAFLAPPSALPLSPALVFDGAAPPPAWAGPAFGAADGLVRGALAAGLLLAVRIVYRHTRGIEGMGLGDVKLAGAAAPWLAWPDLPTALLLAVLAALVAVMGTAVAGRKAPETAAWIPFGAFLAPAAWVVWTLREAGVAIPLLG